jgi:putative copper export protein
MNRKAKQARRVSHRRVPNLVTERVMHALKDFLTTDYGLMSLAVIVFMLGMGVFFTRYFLKHMREDEAAAKAAGAKR